jgi:hypothetical protein
MKPSHSERLCQYAFAAHNDIALFNLMQKASEHGLHVEAPIVPEAVLVQIGLQVVTANRVINALDTVLDQRPETFDGLRMHVASNIDFLAVPNAPMVVVMRGSGESGINRVVIRKHKIRWQDVLFNQPLHRVFLHIGSHECTDAALALYESDHWRFSFLVRRASAALHSLLAAVVHFVNFDWLLASAQLRSVFGFVQHRTNLLKHAPRGFIRYASLALNLLRGNPASRLRHEIDRVEPSRERSGRLVEDRASGRVNVMAAMIARVRRTAHNAMVLGQRFALSAIDAFRIQAITKPIKAGRVIRELFLEVSQCVRQHVRLAVVVCHLVTYCQVKSYQMCVPTVKV